MANKDLDSNPLLGNELTAKMIENNNVSRMVIDRQNKKIIAFSKDILINQLRRETPKIQKSFDTFWEAELIDLGVEYSNASSLISLALLLPGIEDHPRQMASAHLLGNAANSFIAAVQLLRDGFVLQPGILLRTLIESIGIAVYIFTNDGALEKYQAGKLDSGYAIKKSTEALPLLGRLYGFYSNKFSHISDLHRTFTGVTLYKGRPDDAVDTNIGMLKVCIWHLYLTAEVIFHDLVASPRYWKSVEHGYEFAPNDDEKKWMAKFLNAD